MRILLISITILIVVVIIILNKRASTKEQQLQEENKRKHDELICILGHALSMSQMLCQYKRDNDILNLDETLNKVDIQEIHNKILNYRNDQLRSTEYRN